MNNYTCEICGNKATLSISGLFDDRYGALGKHSIYTCNSCGFGKTLPGIPRNKIADFYSRHYPTSHFTVAQVTKSVHIPSAFRTWLSGLDCNLYLYTKPREKVLDIGFGSGVSLLAIRQLGGIPYGIEPDPSVKDIAKHLNLPIHIGFITDNPFPKLKFDLITASQVLEHEPDPLSFLLATKKKLAKNGRVVLSLPNYNALYRTVFGHKWLHWHVPYHLNFFTHKSLKILVKNAGFNIHKIRTITPTAWTVWQLHMIFAKTKEGEISTAWDTIVSGGDTSQSVFKRRIYYILNISLEIMLTPINRIIDMFQLGESFLVELIPIENKS